MKTQPVNIKNIHNGTRHIYRFINNYGASVIDHESIRGKELAVLKFTGADNYDVTYSTPITEDVVPCIESDEYLQEILNQIEQLPQED